MAVAALMVASTALSMYGQNKSAKASAKASKAQAAQVERQAKSTYAADQLRAAEYTRESDTVASNARTAIAAGGGVTTDAGSTDIISKIDSEGIYNRLAALYDAKNNYDGTIAQGQALRTEAKNTRKASRYAIGATALSGAADAYGAYKPKKIT